MLHFPTGGYINLRFYGAVELKDLKNYLKNWKEHETYPDNIPRKD